MSLRQKLRTRMWLFLLQEDGDQNEEEDGQYGYDSYGTPTSGGIFVDYHTCFERPVSDFWYHSTLSNWPK